MLGKFVIAQEIETKIDDSGSSSRLSDPVRTGAKQLTAGSNSNLDTVDGPDGKCGLRRLCWRSLPRVRGS